MSLDLKFTTLKHTDETAIYQAFTLAFENYVIPLEFNQYRTFERWHEAGVDFNLSYGAFHGEELVAFVLQVPVGGTLYNFGTGVIPSYRGQHLIQKIYDVIRKELPEFEKFTLEVIQENTPALSLYRKLEFEITRELISLKGTLTSVTRPEKNLTYDITPLKSTDDMQRIRLAHPSSEFSRPVLGKYPDRNELHTLKKDDDLLSYAIYTPGPMTLKEFGALDRNEKFLDQLFFQMKTIKK